MCCRRRPFCCKSGKALVLHNQGLFLITFRIRPPSIGKPKETSPYCSHGPRKPSQPNESNQYKSQPCEQRLAAVDDQFLQKHWGWKFLGHIRVVKFRKSERGLAEFTVFLLRMREPFHQAGLMDELDTSAAFARVKQLFFP